jgi:hypothetical protein
MNYSKSSPDKLFILKSGEMFVTKNGLTSQQKYARTFFLKDAITKKRQFAKRNVFVDLIEL